MTKTKKSYHSEIIFFVLMMLIYFLIFSLGGKKVLAAENGKVNLELWTLGEIDSDGNATLTDYQIDDDLKDIVIPNAADYIESDSTKYKNLRKVYITREIMNKAAQNGDKYHSENEPGGSLKISDTGKDDSSFTESQKKVFAEGEDWSDTFNGNGNSFGGSAINYIESIDLSRFDTSNITDMSLMFSFCSSLTSLDVSSFETSDVTNMYRMFYCCSNLTNLDVSSFDTSNVTNMSWIFYDCSNLTNLDVSNFDTSNVIDMPSMFSGCSGLTSLDVSNFDTRNVTSMSSMFSRCSGLTSLDVSSFETSNVINMYSMFYNCSNLTDLDVSNFDTRNVTNMSWMFYNCSNLTNLDVSNFDTRSVTNMSWMFYNCSNLLYLDLTKFNLDNLDRSNVYDDIFAINGKEKRREPLLITTNDEFLNELTTLRDNCQNRILFTTTLKVDGNNVKFKGDDESEFVKYNNDKTEKYINLYTTYTTMDSEEEILQKLADRLEEEKKNLIVVPGYENLEWEPEKDTEGKVSYSLQNVYTIKKIEKEEKEDKGKSYSWSTIENSGGSFSGGSSSVSQNQNLISKNESTNTKTNTQIEPELPEKLRMHKYLFGYPDGKIKPENYATRAEFATVIYRLMNNGEKINYDKLKDIAIEKSDWFADAVAYLIDDSRKIISITDNKFNPSKNVTGYEMLNIIHNVLKFYGADKNFVIPQDLIDLNSYVTRLEMTQIIFNAFDRKDNPGQKIYSDLDKNNWAYKFLMDASE